MMHCSPSFHRLPDQFGSLVTQCGKQQTPLLMTHGMSARVHLVFVFPRHVLTALCRTFRHFCTD